MAFLCASGAAGSWLAAAKARQAAVSPEGAAPLREGQSQTDFKVITVGTGGPPYDANRTGPATLIQFGDQYVLVDMGDGTRRHLAEAGIPDKAIAAYCFTHHHRDHNDDALSILPQAWAKGIASPIIGPKGTSDLVDFLWDFYETDLSYRAGKRGSSLEALKKPTVYALPHDGPIEIAGLTITATEVPHTITTFAYRFQAGDRAIVVSGDLTWSQALVDLAKGAHILVIDSGAIVYEGDSSNQTRGDGRRANRARGANRRGAANKGGPNQQESGNRRAGASKQRAHASLEEVARMGAEAGVAKLVLTHFRPGTIDKTETLRRMRGIFSGEIFFAEDMDVYE